MSNFPVRYLQHSGERSLRDALGVPADLSNDMGRWPSKFMPQQHADFFGGLDYFAVGSLDSAGRPWASVLIADRDKPVPPVTVLDAQHLQIDVSAAETTAWTPWRDHMSHAASLKDGKLVFAGLGMDVTNRRRNKVGGQVRSRDITVKDGRLRVVVESDESMGNCPKYITVRPDIRVVKEPAGHTELHLHAEQKQDAKGGSDVPPLTKEARAIINIASTVWMATRHYADPKAGPGSAFDSMDVNHRGGNPGFVRVSTDGRHVYLPDYSGNRIYSSMGNIVTDRVAGMTFVNFENGDILYVTGDAEVLIGPEASLVMPRQKLLVKLHVTDWALVRAGLNLRAGSNAFLSPYNPKVRPLAEEAALADTSTGAASNTAVQLINSKAITDDMAVFRFRSSAPVTYLPGQYVVLDFSEDEHLPQGYRHMNDADPRSLNDDFVRTWTISSSPPQATESKGDQSSLVATDEFECTIKRVTGGRISTLLHTTQTNLNIQFVGIAGDFTCFDKSGRLLHNNMLWLAAGSGITPFVSMWSALQAACASKRLDMPAVRLVFSSRSQAELEWARRVFEGVTELHLFNTNSAASSDAKSTFQNRRPALQDIQSLGEKTTKGTQPAAFLCGPDGFSESVLSWLHESKFPSDKIHHESFKF